MGVTIPCGRSWWKPGDIAGHCVAGHLCPNCTALRGLVAACESLIETCEGLVGQQAMPDDWWIPKVKTARAALAAARPVAAEPTKE